MQKDYEGYKTVKNHEPLDRRDLADRKFVLALIAVQTLTGDDVDALAMQEVWQGFDSKNVTLNELSTAMRFHNIGVEVKQVHFSQGFANRLARWQHEEGDN